MDLFKWSGDDIRGFDHEPSKFHPDYQYIRDENNCRLYADLNGISMIGKSPLGNRDHVAIRFCIELTGYPSSTIPLISPLTSTNTTSWTVRLTSSGGVIVYDALNAQKGWSSTIPLNTELRIEILANTTGVKLRVYDGPYSNTLIGSEVSTSSGTYDVVDNFRFGFTAASHTAPPFYVDDILLTDDMTWIGPRVDSLSLTTPRIAIIGDSLTSMSGANGEYIRQACVSDDVPTQNVYLWGVGGKKILDADLTGKNTLDNIIDAQSMLGTVDQYIFALGTNDRPSNNATIEAAILEVLSSIEETASVTWIGLTSRGTISSDDVRVNAIIQSFMGLHDSYSYADWNSYIRNIDGGDNNSPLWITSDNTHMSSSGYAIRAEYYVDHMMKDRRNLQPWTSAMLGNESVSKIYMNDKMIFSK